MSEASTIERENIKEIGPLLFDLDRRTVHGPRGRVMLAPVLFSLLERLSRRPGVIVEYDALISAVWPDPDTEPAEPTRNIGISLCRLRNLFECLGVTGPSGVEIRTEPTIGICLRKKER